MIGRGLYRRVALLAGLLLALAAVLAPAARAEQSAGVAAPLGARRGAIYRRVFVPEGRLEDWPTGDAPYLPMARDEFERLVKSTEERRDLASAVGVQIDSAQYAAELTDDGALRGRAALRVSLLDNRPRVLPLAPLNIGLANARWAGEPAQGARSLIGQWQGGADGFGALVRNSGELHFDWTLPPRTVLGDELVFQLRLPAATASQLQLDLPPDCLPSISPGYAREPNSKGGPTTKRHVLQLGPGAEHRLKIRRPAAAEAPADPRPQVAISEAYQLRPAGLDYEAVLRVESLAASEVVFRAVGQLRIAEVLIDRRPVAFRREDDGETFQVSVPRSTLPVNITVRATAPTVLGKPWKLPFVAPLAAFWTEGTSTLLVDEALELQAIDVRGGQLVNTLGIGGADDRGEAYRLQLWDPEAAISVTVSKQAPRVAAQVATTAELADREVFARTHARLWSDEGRLFQLAATVDPEWTLESVEAASPDEVVSWHVSGEGDQRQLSVQLRRSPTALAPLRLVLTGRRPIRSWLRAATVGELDWLDFRDADLRTEHLLVRDRGGGALVADAIDAPGLVELESLDTSSRDLLELPARGLLVDLAVARGDVAIRAPFVPARFDAEGRLELAKSGAGFEHRTVVACRPTSGAVNELTVLAARPIPADARWTLRGSDLPVHVEPLGSAQREQANDSAAAEQAVNQYRVRLSRPQSRPFELEIAWRGSQAGGDRVNSIALPGATTWQSWAILRGDASEVAVDAAGFLPAAARPSPRPADEAGRVLGCFRLSDDPFVTQEKAPSLTIRRAAAVDHDAQAVCWRLEIETLQFDDGRQTHRFVYHLETQATCRISLAPASGLRVTAARLDGRTTGIGPGEKLELQLVPREGGSALVLDVEGRRAELGNFAAVAPPQVHASFPVLNGRWTVSAPAHYVPSETDRSPRGREDWLARLFGPLLPSAASVRSRSGVLAEAKAAAGHVGAARLAERETGAPLAPAGWTAVSQQFVGEPRPTSLAHVGSRQAAWHIAWLITALLAARYCMAKPRWIVAGAVAAAALALIVPMWAAPWPQAVLLGALAGTAARGVVAATQTSAVRGAGHVAACCAVVASLAWGQAPAARAQVATPPAVLYPIDEDGKPVGADVYVPASLFNELSPSPAGPLDEKSAVLAAANHRIELSAAANGKDVVCSQCVLRLRWRTMGPNVTVALPLLQSDGVWLAEKQTLDGLPVHVAWNGSEGCTVSMADAGLHELELVVAPQAVRVGDRRQLTLQIPPVPGAHVEIVHPPGIAPTVSDAVVDRAASSQTRTAATLGSGGVLDCRWPARMPAAAADGIKLEQLTWLNVEPANSTLEVRLLLAGDVSSMDTLHLATSPELKLLPLPDSSPVYELQTHPGAPNVVELKFRGPPQLPLALVLRFQLQRMSSIGRFAFPSVRLADVEPALHHFVVTADPTLRLRDEPAVGMAPLTGAEIDQRWSGLPPAQLRYGASGARPPWSMYVEKSAARFIASETLGLSCSRRDVAVSYTAAVGSLEGETLVHGVMVPAEFQVESASVELDAAAAPMAARWSRPRGDLVQIFLGRPLDEPHTIRITGRLPYDEHRRTQVPKMLLAGASASPIRVAVNRSSDVLVELGAGVDAGGELDLSPGDGELAGLPVARFEMGRNDDVPPTVAVRDNAAELHGQLLLQLDGSANPRATCVLRGEVAAGVVDSLSLVVDASWQGPLACSGDAVVSERTLPNDNSRRLVSLKLLEPAPQGSEFTLRLEGGLDLRANQRVRFPAVTLLHAARQDLYLALPPAAGSHSAEWTLIGVEQAPLPAELASDAGPAGESPAYRVERERFVAERRVFPQVLRQAGVRLLYTRAVVDERGGWSAVSEIIVQPGGLTDWTINMPEEVELLYAEVDGQPVDGLALSSRKFAAPPGSPYLPRTVTVAFRRTRAHGSGPVALATPQVVQAGRPFGIARALWEVDAPSSRWRAADGVPTLSRDRLARAVRDERLAAVVEASPLALQLPGWEADQWFLPWLDRIGAAPPGPAGDGDERESAFNALVERLGAVVPQAERRRSGAPRRLVSESTSGACYEGAGDGRLTLSAPSAGFSLGRWLVAVGLVAGMGVAWRRPAWFDHVLKSSWAPAAAGLAVGVFWWIALWPPLVGPAIIVLSLAALFKARRLQRGGAGEVR